MAVPTVVGVGTAASGTGSITPGLPSGWQQNDILLVFIENYYGEKSTVSGYTQLITYDHPTPYRTITVYWKRAGSSESDPTVSDSGDFQIAAVMAVRGCPTTGSPFGEVLATANGASSTGLTAAIKTYVPDCLVISAVGEDATGAPSQSLSGWTNANLSNITEELDYYANVGQKGVLGLVTGSKATAGSVGATTFSQTYYIASVAVTIAMLPETTTGMFFRGVGPLNSLTTSISAQVPYGVAENDILIALVETADEAVTVTGYTEAVNSPASNTGPIGGNPTRLSVFYKRAGAGETTASVSDSGNHQNVQILAVAGAKTSGDPFNVTASTTGGYGTSITVPGGTTTVANTLVIAAMSSSYNLYVGSWTNANLTGLQSVVGYYGQAGNGGSLSAAVGSYSSIGSYGNSTGTIAGNSEWTGWSGALEAAVSSYLLSADSGTLTMAGADAAMSWFAAEAGSLTATGENATFRKGYSLTADAAVYGLTGQLAAGIFGYGMFADYGALSLTQSASTFDQCMKAAYGATSLEASETTILAPTPVRSTLNFLIDLIPSTPAANYQRFSQKLTADGQDVPVLSWTYSESPAEIGGKLEVQLADVADRTLFTSGTEIVFEVGVWNGSSFDWHSLLNTGALRNSSWNVSGGADGPRDSFTLIAMTELEDRLSAAPTKNTVWYDPQVATFSSSDVVPITDADGVVTQGEAVSIQAMDLYKIMQRVFVTEAGFTSYVTNIPNFRIGQVAFDAGTPYASVLGGIIGMYEPTYSMLPNGGISVNDGTVAKVSGLPSGRTLTASKATSLGIAKDFSTDGLSSIGAIEVSVSDNGSVFQYVDTRQVVETVTTGAFGRDTSDYIETVTTTDYTDFYDSRHGSVPFRSETAKIVTESYRNGQLSGTLTDRRTEKFSYQFGNLVSTYRSNETLLPTFAGGELTGYSLQFVSEDYERLSRSLHPYEPDRTYIAEKNLVSWGLVYIDKTQQQLEEDYVRDAVSVLRAGNARTDMETDYRKIKTLRETFQPNADGTSTSKRSEYDFLSDVVSYEESRLDEAELGKNSFLGNQNKLVVYPPGGSAVSGQVTRLNAGELPIDEALSLARRKLKLARSRKEAFSFDMIGVDPTLQQGTLVDAYGRGSAPLGAFVVESRRMSGTRSGYTMSITARSAE